MCLEHFAKGVYAVKPSFLREACSGRVLLQFSYLIQIGETFQSADLGFADVCYFKVGVQRCCEIKGLIAGIDNSQIGPQGLAM